MPRRTLRSVRQAVTSSGSRWTWPFHAGRSPTMTFRSVVLPAPLAPSRTTDSFGFTSRPAPQRTWTRPYPVSMPAARMTVSGMVAAAEEHADNFGIFRRVGQGPAEELLAGGHDND